MVSQRSASLPPSVLPDVEKDEDSGSPGGALMHNGACGGYHRDEMEQQVIEPMPAPSIVDIKRLAKVKAEQSQRLMKLRSRVDRLNAQERKVWKDVAWTQQMSLQAQEAQLRRQAEQADRMRQERELHAQEQQLRERARDQRHRTVTMRDAPRLAKFEDNKALGHQVREDSRRYMGALQNVRDRTLKSKATLVELRREQAKQVKLQRELEIARREHERHEENALRFLELQEEIANSDVAIAVAERGEMSAVQRLQNSQTIRAEVLTQFHSASCGLEAAADDNGLDDSPTDLSPPAGSSSSSFGAGPRPCASASTLSAGSRPPLRLTGGSQSRGPAASASQPLLRTGASGGDQPRTNRPAAILAAVGIGAGAAAAPSPPTLSGAASTGALGQICEEWQDEDYRQAATHQQNRGGPTARQLAPTSARREGPQSAAAANVAALWQQKLGGSGPRNAQPLAPPQNAPPA